MNPIKFINYKSLGKGKQATIIKINQEARCKLHSPHRINVKQENKFINYTYNQKHLWTVTITLKADAINLFEKRKKKKQIKKPHTLQIKY